MLLTNGTSLSIQIRGVHFEGADLDSLSPAANTKPEDLHAFRFVGGCLCDCSFDIDFLIQVSTPSGFEETVLSAHLELGKQTSKEWVDVLTLILQVKFDGRTFQSTGKSGWFENELLELEKQLPVHCRFRLCISCAFSDYSPYGHGMFGCLACFRDNKTGYSQVKSKADLFNVWDSLTEYVQETHVCDEYVLRQPRTGYRG